MTDRPGIPFTVSSARVGRMNMGPGSVSIEDEAIVIVLHSASDDRPFRIALSVVESVVIDGAEVAVAIDDGTRLALMADGANGVEELCDEIIVRCRTIPEMTRALRAFGSRRGHRSARESGPSEQQRFFAPLLHARRVAVASREPTAAIRAFDSETLGRAIAAALESFAVERHGENGPARRALEAELVDLTEPLRDELNALGHAAEDARARVDDLRRWRAWSDQLRRTFEVADRVWMLVDGALDSIPWRE
jgi:hypothetical protein